ncbi:MAG: L,D-transpeptidase [Bacteroidales bacterium]|nr:L,D-transpeptidase [Bacteroidales bacterium]
MNNKIIVSILKMNCAARGGEKEILLFDPAAFLLQFNDFAKAGARFLGALVLRAIIALAIMSVILFLFIMFALPLIQNLNPLFSHGSSNTILTGSTSQKENDEQKQKVVKSIKSYQKLFAAKVPRSHYLVINTTENKFSLRSGNQTLRTGFCSTGSLTVLKKSEQEKWAFQTPKGIRTVRGKITNPVWKKPDWAFVEEGLPIPSANHSSRYDYSTLGDYALDLGNGYLIHGTLYQRLLGMPVTHGCIRLGDDDLEFVYKNLQPGAKVIIY